MSSNLKLKDFIRSIRSCRTVQEEKSFIYKEFSKIQTAFKSGDCKNRNRNIAKLVFMSLMGYPVEFGDMECFTLIGSNKFTHKRIGYLAIQQLIGGNSTMVLLTNTLKTDVKNSNQFTVSLALTAIGNVATEEICMTTVSDITNLINSANPYLKRKAATVATRLISRVNSFSKLFAPYVIGLLNDKNRSVKLCACHLIEYTAEDLDKESVWTLLINDLERTLSESQFSNSDYEVNSIFDPFLQMAILRALRILMKNGFVPVALNFSQILAQMASNTDHSKNTGNAILYECVMTIFSLPAEMQMDQIGIAVLEKFLQHRDRCIRYIGLKILSDSTKRLDKIPPTCQALIVDCLSDVDSSIVEKAFEVSLLFMEEGNCEEITNNILQRLEDFTIEKRVDAVNMLESVIFELNNLNLYYYLVEKLLHFAPSEIGSNLRDRVLSVLSDRNQINYSRLCRIVEMANKEKLPFVIYQIAIWIIGEYANALCKLNMSLKECIEQVITHAVETCTDSVTNLPFFGQYIPPKYQVFTPEETLLFICPCLIKLISKCPDYTDYVIGTIEKISAHNSTSMRSTSIRKSIFEFKYIVSNITTEDRVGLQKPMNCSGNLEKRRREGVENKKQSCSFICLLDFDENQQMAPGLTNERLVNDTLGEKKYSGDILNLLDQSVSGSNCPLKVKENLVDTELGSYDYGQSTLIGEKDFHEFDRIFDSPPENPSGVGTSLREENLPMHQYEDIDYMNLIDCNNASGSIGECSYDGRHNTGDMKDTEIVNILDMAKSNNSIENPLTVESNVIRSQLSAQTQDSGSLDETNHDDGQNRDARFTTPKIGGAPAAISQEKKLTQEVYSDKFIDIISKCIYKDDQNRKIRLEVYGKNIPVKSLINFSVEPLAGKGVITNVDDENYSESGFEIVVTFTGNLINQKNLKFSIQYEHFGEEIDETIKIPNKW